MNGIIGLRETSPRHWQARYQGRILPREGVGTMKKIPGGIAVVKDMKERYGAVYKNRRAMIEILNKK